MFKKYITLVFFVALFFVSTDLWAQCPPCPPGQQCNAAAGICVPVVGGVPIDGDGGLMILLAAGIAFGIKKLLDSKKSLS
jgi:hypothetical protein